MPAGLLPPEVTIGGAVELGISSYTYVWSAGVEGYPAPPNPLTCESLIRHAVRLGVTVVQIADNLPLDRLPDARLDALARHARDCGIRIEPGTRGIQPEILRPYLEIARWFGSPILRTLLDGPSHQPSEEEAGGLLRQIAPEFRGAGVKLAIENHDRFRASALRRVVEAAASDSIGICLDTANSLGCGETVDQVLDVLADLVVNLHIKDFWTRRLPHHKGFIVEGAPAGKGLLDIPALLGRLAPRSAGMSAILELWTPPEATAEASVEKEKRWAEESIRYLRTLLPAASPNAE